MPPLVRLPSAASPRAKYAFDKLPAALIPRATSKCSHSKTRHFAINLGKDNSAHLGNITAYADVCRSAIFAFTTIDFAM